MLPERFKIFLFLVVVLEYSLANVHLLVDVGVLKQLVAVVAATEGDAALRASAGTCGHNRLKIQQKINKFTGMLTYIEIGTKCKIGLASISQLRPYLDFHIDQGNTSIFFSLPPSHENLAIPKISCLI